MALLTHYDLSKSSEAKIEGIFQIQDRFEKEDYYLLKLRPVSRSNHYSYHINISKTKINFPIQKRTYLKIVGERKTTWLRNFSNSSFSSKIIIQPHQIHLTKISSSNWEEGLLSFRENLDNYLSTIATPKTRGFLLALLFANREYLADHLLFDFKSFGLIHLLSISGLHILSLYQVLSQILIKISKKRYLSSLLSLLVTYLYLLLIGIPFSGLRAFIMICLKEAAGMVGREYDAYTALALSTLVIQIYDALCIYDIGLWLSMLATLGVISLPKTLQKRYSHFWQIIFCELWILPVLALIQGEIQVLTIILNLVVTPLVILIFYIGWTGIGLSLFLYELSEFVLRMIDVILILLEKIFLFFEKVSIGYFMIERRNIWLIALYYIMLISLILYLNTKENY